VGLSWATGWPGGCSEWQWAAVHLFGGMLDGHTGWPSADWGGSVRGAWWMGHEQSRGYSACEIIQKVPWLAGRSARAETTWMTVDPARSMADGD